MTLLKVAPDKTYGTAYKNVAFDVDHEVFNLPPDRALFHILDAAKDDILKTIAHYTKQGWEVDYQRNPRYFKSPLQMDVDALPAIDTFTHDAPVEAQCVNARLYRTGNVQMVARIYFKKVLYDLLPRPEELLGEEDGFVSRDELEAFVPDEHKSWKVQE